MKRANEILREHGIDVTHPTREQILTEMQNCSRAGVMPTTRRAQRRTAAAID